MPRKKVKTASAWKVGQWVRFAHEALERPSFKIAAINKDGMLELEDWTGWFHPEIFVAGKPR
jgi:hypothetical protein